MTSKEQQGLHRRACKILGVDPEKVRLVGPAEYRELEGHVVGPYAGRAGLIHPIVWVRRGEGLAMHLHEILHLLFLSRPHWWVYSAAWKLAGISQASRAYGFGRAFRVAAGEREIENIDQLKALASKAAMHKGWAEERR